MSVRITNTAVHGIERDEHVALRHLPMGCWVLSVGPVDFYADKLDALAAVVDHADRQIKRARS